MRRTKQNTTTTRTAPARPAWLPDAAAREWDALADAADAAGTLSPTDGHVLTLAATAAAELAKAEAALDAEGRVVVYPNGIPGVSPWVKIRDSAARKLEKALPALGLTPAARRASRVADPAEVDELAEYYEAVERRAASG